MARAPVPVAPAPINAAIDRHLEGQPAGGMHRIAALGAGNEAIADGTRRAVALAAQLCTWAAKDLREGHHGDASAFLGRAHGQLNVSDTTRYAKGFDRLATDLADLGRNGQRLVLLNAHSMRGNLCHVLEGDQQRRIFLHPAFHQRDVVDRAISLIHEISHHVLRTEDLHSYPGGHLFFNSAKRGAQKYQHAIVDHLAQISPKRARTEMSRNADSWANLAAVMALTRHREALDTYIQADKASPRPRLPQAATRHVQISNASPIVWQMSSELETGASADAQRYARKGDAPLTSAGLLAQLQDAPWSTLSTAERAAFHEAAVSLANEHGFIEDDALPAHMDGLSDENVLVRLNTLLPLLGLAKVDRR